MEVSQAFLQNLDHLGTWGVLTTDANLLVTGWNRWLEQRSGKSAAEVVGRRLFEVYPDLTVRSMDRYYRQALAGQSCILSQGFHKYLLPMPPTVSNTRLMKMQQTARLAPLVDQGAVIGTLTLIEDVTERIVTDEELRKQAERLEESNRHKDEFLAMLAHELRNPLAPIRNGIRLLEMLKADAPEARQTRDMMQRQVAHMSRLVDDLLDVSRIASGKVRLRKESCDLNAIACDVLEDYRPIIQDAGIHLTPQLSGEPCLVQGDAVRLAQIIGNLLHNANKFTNPGGTITAACEMPEHSNSVVFRISDTGIGMNRETLSRVFEAFAQADSSLERSKGGLGLGLSLARGLTELHGGTLEALSDGLGRGSTFTLRLPRLSDAAVQTKLNNAPAPVQNTRRILIIEDNRDMAFTAKLLLTRYGFQVDCAETGPAGVEAARTFLPHIVLCDIGLPGMDGYEVARRLRADALTERSFLIAQSGYGREEDLRNSQDAGFDLHLTKPVDYTELHRILNSVPQEPQ